MANEILVRSVRSKATGIEFFTDPQVYSPGIKTLPAIVPAPRLIVAFAVRLEASAALERLDIVLVEEMFLL